MQGNFCIYKISDEDATSTSGKADIVTNKDEGATEETQAGDNKEEENKINKKLKLSEGLPTNYSFEVKVMVYIVRVRIQYFYALFRCICCNFVQLMICFLSLFS